MKRRKPKIFRIKSRIAIITAVVAVIILTVFAVLTDKAVRPVAEKQAEHFSLVKTSETIEKAVSEYISLNAFTYGDFAVIAYDGTGKVSAVETLPHNINKVQSELALMINEKLGDIKDSYVKIPVGSLTGSYMLAEKGMKIKLRISPSGKADVKLKSEFTSAGNNQTCHRISAEVTAEIKSALPLYDFETTADFEFLLAENIIVGEVPTIRGADCGILYQTQ
ncbi:MAG: sporulation protein YunB [Ruminococcus sp.]|nr:sporulation protein YunB [Ruminococcus sp.]